MSSYPINSGTLNSVPFPASETGLAIIELIGTTEVTGTIPSVTLRLTASAKTEASAGGNASLKMRRTVPATVTASGLVSDISARTKIPLAGDTACSASTSAGNVLKYVFGGTASGTATSTVTSYQKSFKSAATSGVSTATVNTVRWRPASALVSASALSSVKQNLIKRGVSFTQVASATSRNTIALAYRLGSSTVGTATPTVNSVKDIHFAASGLSKAQTSTAERMNISIGPINQASIADASSGLVLVSNISATTLSEAVVNEPMFVFRLQTGAYTPASVSATSVALDYTVTLPAPSYRQMVVPARETLIVGI